MACTTSQLAHTAWRHCSGLHTRSSEVHAGLVGVVCGFVDHDSVVVKVQAAAVMALTQGNVSRATAHAHATTAPPFQFGMGEVESGHWHEGIHLTFAG